MTTVLQLRECIALVSSRFTKGHSAYNRDSAQMPGFKGWQQKQKQRCAEAALRDSSLPVLLL
jgi:hypothetical protein